MHARQDWRRGQIRVYVRGDQPPRYGAVITAELKSGRYGKVILGREVSRTQFDAAGNGLVVFEDASARILPGDVVPQFWDPQEVEAELSAWQRRPR